MWVAAALCLRKRGSGRFSRRWNEERHLEIPIEEAVMQDDRRARGRGAASADSGGDET
jgi:hypothetical protein